MAAVLGGRFLRSGLGFDDARRADGDFDAAVGVESPIHDVVIVPDHRGRAEHKLSVRAAIHFALLKVPPSRALRIALEKASHVGAEFGSTRLAGRQAIEPCRASGTVQAGTHWLEMADRSEKLS